MVRDNSILLKNEDNNGLVRDKRSLVWLRDYDCSSLELANKVDSKGNKKILYLMQHSISYANISPSYKKFIACTNDIIEPDTFAEAIKDYRWVQAMKNEITALERNRTWEIV